MKKLVKVTPLEEFKVQLYCQDEVRVYDCSSLLNTGDFIRLRDKKFFSKVFVNFDTISWPNDLEIDPEVLYQDSHQITP